MSALTIDTLSGDQMQKLIALWHDSYEYKIYDIAVNAYNRAGSAVKETEKQYKAAQERIANDFITGIHRDRSGRAVMSRVELVATEVRPVNKSLKVVGKKRMRRTVETDIRQAVPLAVIDQVSPGWDRHFQGMHHVIHMPDNQGCYVITKWNVGGEQK